MKRTFFQRALLHGMKEEALLELPSGYKSAEVTEEQMQKRQQRAKKRREQAQEKREKDKVNMIAAHWAIAPGMHDKLRQASRVHV